MRGRSFHLSPRLLHGTSFSNITLHNIANKLESYRFATWKIRKRIIVVVHAAQEAAVHLSPEAIHAIVEAVAALEAIEVEIHAVTQVVTKGVEEAAVAALGDEEGDTVTLLPRQMMLGHHQLVIQVLLAHRSIRAEIVLQGYDQSWETLALARSSRNGPRPAMAYLAGT